MYTRCLNIRGQKFILCLNHKEGHILTQLLREGHVLC